MDLSYNFRIYTLPADGDVGHDDFMRLLLHPGQVWVADYSYAQDDLDESILRADGTGIPIHMLLNAVQASTPATRDRITKLRDGMKHGDLTLSTAGPLSPKPHYIMHDKVMVTEDPDGGEDWCWLGAVNFTTRGWKQANTAVLFRSSQWSRSIFIPWFEQTREWALRNIPQQPEVVAKFMALWDDGQEA
jgi:hypothetical protein